MSKINEASSGWIGVDLGRTHLDQKLEVTNRKDLLMIELWDDRCVSMETNTGRIRDQSQDETALLL